VRIALSIDIDDPPMPNDIFVSTALVFLQSTGCGKSILDKDLAKTSNVHDVSTGKVTWL